MQWPSNGVIKNNMNLPTHSCKRCGHKWHPRTDKMAKNCPKCNSPYWNRERESKVPKL